MRRSGDRPADGSDNGHQQGHADGQAGRDFTAIRAEFTLPAEFPADVLAEAQRVAGGDRDGHRVAGDRVDLTDLPLVTVDPAGSMDLDQALLIEREHRVAGAGFLVNYAIADLSFYVSPLGRVHAEALRRGQTLYLPDGMVPLHPRVLSEGVASLLPGRVRPAVVWTMRTASDGAAVSHSVRRAWVRSVARFDFDQVATGLAAGTAHPSLAALPAFGAARRELAGQRGAIELELPEQEVLADGTGGWRLGLRLRGEVESWNAELSLFTGMTAASMMVGAGVGLLRTLPAPDDQVVANLRRSAESLGLPWPAGASPAHMLAGLDSSRPEALALYADATRLLRGAGYTPLTGSLPEDFGHAGLGTPYAHVTAPLRRLVDRFGTEVCLAISDDREIPEWVMRALPGLPAAMTASDRVAAQVERACVNQVTVWSLAGQTGRVFDATVLRSDGGNGGEVLVNDPPIIAKYRGDGCSEGERVRVRLVDVDHRQRRVLFAPEGKEAGG